VSISADPESKKYYAEHKDSLAVLSWSSLAGGFLSGRFNRSNSDEMLENGTYFDKLVIPTYYSEDNFKRLDRADEVGKKRGCSIAQIALAYVLNQDMNPHALTFSRSESEFDQNTKALDIILTENEKKYLTLETDSLD
jgi:aryl-alcohol dehydrogenase-like predicted oxidoreductase